MKKLTFNDLENSILCIKDIKHIELENWLIFIRKLIYSNFK